MTARTRTRSRRNLLFCAFALVTFGCALSPGIDLPTTNGGVRNLSPGVDIPMIGGTGGSAAGGTATGGFLAAGDINESGGTANEAAFASQGGAAGAPTEGRER